MRHLGRISRAMRARVGTLAGILVACWGVFVQFDKGWALIIFGLLLTVWFLLLYDVDEKEPPK